MARERLRLTPPLYHVLLTLGQRPAHGYALIEALSERTGGRLELGPSSLGRLLVAATAEEYFELIEALAPLHLDAPLLRCDAAPREEPIGHARRVADKIHKRIFPPKTASP